MSPTIWDLVEDAAERLRNEKEHAADDDRQRRRLEILKLEREAAERGAGGPPEVNGLTVDEIASALSNWSGDWPPTQPVLAEKLRRSDRRLRQVLRDAGKTWRSMTEEAR